MEPRAAPIWVFDHRFSPLHVQLRFLIGFITIMLLLHILHKGFVFRLERSYYLFSATSGFANIISSQVFLVHSPLMARQAAWPLVRYNEGDGMSKRK